MRTDLVETALRRAVTLRGTLPDDVVFHADRLNPPITRPRRSPTPRKICTCSGPWGAPVCWDNAATESFWSTLKTEFYNRRRWHTKREARLAVGAWIEDRYNRRRRHSSIGMLSPVRFPETATAA